MDKNMLYAADIKPLLEKNAYNDIRKKLSPQRQQKADSFIFEKDRLLCAAAGLMLEQGLRDRSIISRDLAYNEYGKPYLSGVQGFHFNISHSETLAVCAVSDKPVGADVEIIRHFDDDLCNYVYHESEIGQVKSLCRNSSPDVLFTTLWTIKESLMKYFGTGLSLHPKKIEIDLNGTITAKCERFDASDLFFTVSQHSGYVITVCSGYRNFFDSLQFIDILRNASPCKQNKRS